MTYRPTKPPPGVLCVSLELWACTKVTYSDYRDGYTRAEWRRPTSRSEAMRLAGIDEPTPGRWVIREMPRRVEVVIRRRTQPTCQIGGTKRRMFAYGDDDDAYGFGHDSDGSFVFRRDGGDESIEYTEPPKNPASGWERLGVDG